MPRTILAENERTEHDRAGHQVHDSLDRPNLGPRQPTPSRQRGRLQLRSYRRAPSIALPSWWAVRLGGPTSKARPPRRAPQRAHDRPLSRPRPLSPRPNEGQAPSDTLTSRPGAKGRARARPRSSSIRGSLWQGGLADAAGRPRRTGEVSSVHHGQPRTQVGAGRLSPEVSGQAVSGTSGELHPLLSDKLGRARTAASAARPDRLTSGRRRALSGTLPRSPPLCLPSARGLADQETGAADHP